MTSLGGYSANKRRWMQLDSRSSDSYLLVYRVVLTSDSGVIFKKGKHDLRSHQAPPSRAGRRLHKTQNRNYILIPSIVGVISECSIIDECHPTEIFRTFFGLIFNWE